MRWFCRHWYEVGLVPAGVALVFLIVRWDDLSLFQRISTVNFIGIMLHQFEEYGFPGGAPVFLNKYMRGGTERYPLNQFSAMLVNVVIGYLCYLLPVFLPNIIWLGLAPILFGCVFQVMLHLVVFFVKFHHVYNSGLAAVLLIHLPCGFLYIHHAAVQGLLTGRTWLSTIIYMIVMIAFTVLFGQKLFSRKDSSYPFDEKEIEAGKRFARRMGINE
ncbi:HXXEE domain-containing protein [Ruminococcus sp.]|uniref:HXXEE domain-containing protein n=1 Tax=Ruminococcus sp. TaxID=41978 RepID=UPI0025F9887B|nr:HXXEE domain-containing protein [Ruminococcus sp.]MBQ6252898.1 HXXEE domain-containing protein [Ruminococcus sp.]